MLLAPTDDQEFLQETTRRFLTERVPADGLRALRDDRIGFDMAYWRQGAELGWTSLLVSEEHGGGTVSDAGLVDLSLLAYVFGRHAAPGPLVVTNLVAGALSASGGAFAPFLAALLDGTATATWCLGDRSTADDRAGVSIEPAAGGAEVLINGQAAPVEYADAATYLLVTGRSRAGQTQVLLPASTPGVHLARMETVDLTRRFSSVTFKDVRAPLSQVVGALGEARDAVSRQLQTAVALDTAEALGTMDAAFELTLQWTFDRYSFGRPLASYQALKHRMADMKTWLEASRAITASAIDAVARGSTEASTLPSVAKAYIGQYGSELMHECVQLHGGIGLTFEHDLHLFLRRHTVIRALRGTPADHRRELARHLATVSEDP